MSFYEDETNIIFDGFYKKTSKDGKLQRKHNRQLIDDFYSKNNYHLDVEKFLNEQISIKNRSIKVLDIGCGSGKHLVSLAQKNHKGNFFGVDISIKAIGEAKKRINGQELTNNKDCKLNFSVQNASKLDFKDDFFDYVCIVSLLHHLKNYYKIVSEAKRVLKKNGKLIIIDLKGDNFVFNLAKRVVRVLPRKKLEELFKDDIFVDGKFPKRSDISSKNLKKFLLTNNFSFEKESYYYLFFQYFCYLYELFPFLLKISFPLDIFLIKLEKKLKKIFKYNCDMYIFICSKR
jgi:ubiquinone/menaquinone biosynthesis C-methylase UbiE